MCRYVYTQLRDIPKDAVLDRRGNNISWLEDAREAISEEFPRAVGPKEVGVGFDRGSSIGDSIATRLTGKG